MDLVCRLLLEKKIFFNDTATTEIYTLSLHDALPIFKLPDGNGVEMVGRIKEAAPAGEVMMAIAWKIRSEDTEIEIGRASCRERV